ncbi:MAG TPA: hypothetical protein VFQ61_23815, partial [Polyangiaceae bacterium]|nr:hypothetical protein [Polyangiaceae bacterium]
MPLALRAAGGGFLADFDEWFSRVGEGTNGSQEAGHGRHRDAAGTFRGLSFADDAAGVVDESFEPASDGLSERESARAAGPYPVDKREAGEATVQAGFVCACQTPVHPVRCRPT